MSTDLALSTLHPTVDIKVGNQVFNVPPQYLQEFEERTILRGFARTTFKLIDPTYVTLEQAIVQDSKRSGIVRYRWGYSGVTTEWREFAPISILPEMTRRGYTLVIEGVATAASTITAIEPMTFKGKISSVVKQIVDVLHKQMKERGSVGIQKAYIEETGDDENEGGASAKDPNFMGPLDQMVWSTNNLSLLRFIQDKLRPIAVSKQTNKQGYTFRIDTRNNLHFHTLAWEGGRQYDAVSGSWQDGKTPNTKYRVFRYLWGMPGGVLAFRPTILSKVIGGQARGWIASTVDPKTKQYIEKAISRGTTPTDDANPRTMSAPPNENDPTSTKVAEVFRHEPGGNLNRPTNEWQNLSNAVTTATLDLVGLPEYVRFGPDEEYCDVQCYLPVGGKTQLHWTSGRYLIKEVTHSIRLGEYSIAAELFRGSDLDGPYDSKSVMKSAAAFAGRAAKAVMGR